MAGPLILLVGAIYTFVAVDLWWSGRAGLAIAFAGYALSNVGLWLAARQ